MLRVRIWMCKWVVNCRFSQIIGRLSIKFGPDCHKYLAITQGDAPAIERGCSATSPRRLFRFKEGCLHWLLASWSERSAQGYVCHRKLMGSDRSGLAHA